MHLIEKRDEQIACPYSFVTYKTSHMTGQFKANTDNLGPLVLFLFLRIFVGFVFIICLYNISSLSGFLFKIHIFDLRVFFSDLYTLGTSLENPRIL